MLCACNNNVCKISGTLTEPVDTVRLMDMAGALLDVAAVKDGAFVLQCERNPETGVGIVLGEDYDPIALIPDTKKITVSMSEGIPVVTGSPLSQELQELQRWAMTTYSENIEQIVALMEDGDTIGAEAVGAEMNELMATHCREVYKEHQTDALGLQAMGLLMNFIDEEEFINLYEQSSKIIQEDAEIGGFYEYLKSMPKNQVITLLDNGEIDIEDGVFEVILRIDIIVVGTE